VHEGILIDTGADPHPGYNFAFNKEEKFTLREWANAAGKYDWSLPSEEEQQAFKCLKPSTSLDEGRYRQVSFEASTPDCVETIVRTSLTDETITVTWSFTVWPVIEPPVDGSLILLEVDPTTLALPPVAINAGAFFTTRSSEKEYFPNGFPWVEPTEVFTCIDVKNNNFGNFATGYRQWLI
jgi:hypothetical protein